MKLVRCKDGGDGDGMLRSRGARGGFMWGFEVVGAWRGFGFMLCQPLFSLVFCVYMCVCVCVKNNFL